jgi:hypothetical protein
VRARANNEKTTPKGAASRRKAQVKGRRFPEDDQQKYRRPSRDDNPRRGACRCDKNEPERACNKRQMEYVRRSGLYKRADTHKKHRKDHEKIAAKKNWENKQITASITASGRGTALPKKS